MPRILLRPVRVVPDQQIGLGTERISINHPPRYDFERLEYELDAVTNLEEVEITCFNLVTRCSMVVRARKPREPDPYTPEQRKTIRRHSDNFLRCGAACTRCVEDRVASSCCDDSDYHVRVRYKRNRREVTTSDTNVGRGWNSQWQGWVSIAAVATVVGLSHPQSPLSFTLTYSFRET